MDPILHWNEVALEANRVDHTVEAAKREQAGPTLSSRALAIIHLAMYDAYAEADQAAGLASYMPGHPAAPQGAPEAAVAGAAYTALSALYPRQQELFDRALAAAPLGTGATVIASIEYGRGVAQRLLTARANDPRAGAAGYVPSLAPGHHRPDPDNPDQGFYAPFYGAQSKCFAVAVRHGLNPPPGLGSPDYLRALRQVHAKGIVPELAGTIPAVLGVPYRTSDETLTGIYWAYDGAAGLGTPPRLYNQIIRALAVAKGNKTPENARLFALVNAAMGDAGILAWEQKYKHDLWRPILGIREHDSSLGPAGVGGDPISDNSDTQWLPLGAPSTNSRNKVTTVALPGYPSVTALTDLVKNFTPNFPAYPSGHATFGAAAFHIARRFYGVTGTGDDTLFDGLTFVSEELNGVNKDNQGTVRPRHARSFPGGLWKMIRENGYSRVFLGVHWIFDAFMVDEDGNPDLEQNIGGVPLGLAIANDIFDSGLSMSSVMPEMMPEV